MFAIFIKQMIHGFGIIDQLIFVTLIYNCYKYYVDPIDNDIITLMILIMEFTQIVY